MRKVSTTCSRESIPEFEHLEEWARLKVQGFIQDLLEEEVEVLLGRSRYERSKAVDSENGYRNGYGKPRRISLKTWTVEVKRPRVRNLEERFESRILPLFQRRTKEVGDLLPELYLHGLSQGDFELALRGVLGEGAPLSASSIQRLKAKWEVEYEIWKEEDLSELEPVYLWADGIYVRAGIGKDKAVLLVVIASLKDGSKKLLIVESGFRESMESWAGVLRSLKERGLRAPKPVAADGHLGIWGALTIVYPLSKEQRCWNHKITNVLDKLPKKVQPEAKEYLCCLPYAQTRAECERLDDLRRLLRIDIPKPLRHLSAIGRGW